MLVRELTVTEHGQIEPTNCSVYSGFCVSLRKDSAIVPCLRRESRQINLTFSASVKLSPHGNMPVPSPRMNLNVLALDSREQSVPYDAVLIPVRGKILKQKRIPFLVSFKIC